MSTHAVKFARSHLLVLWIEQSCRTSSAAQLAPPRSHSTAHSRVCAVVQKTLMQSPPSRNLESQRCRLKYGQMLIKIHGEADLNQVGTRCKCIYAMYFRIRSGSFNISWLVPRRTTLRIDDCTCGLSPSDRELRAPQGWPTHFNGVLWHSMQVLTKPPATRLHSCSTT
jgi:hypothetical protein